MAYCLQPGESIDAAVCRIAHEQFVSAMRRLTADGSDRDDDIHSARKSMKRMRGLIRLVRPSLGKELYAHENDAYREAAGRISGLRDATVLISTLESVHENLSADLAPASGAVHAWLIQRRTDAYAAADPQDDAIAQVVTDLHAADVRVDDWPLAGMGWAELAGGIRPIYARGRKEYDECCWRPTVTNLHDWRKRVKYLWYHTQLLSPIWPGPMQGLIDELDQLGDLLGLDHDCAVLAEVIREQMPEDMLPRAERDGVVAAIFARRRRLQESCRLLGGRLYAEKPRAFVERLTRYWDGWQEEQRILLRPASAMPPPLDPSGEDAGAAPPEDAASAASAARSRPEVLADPADPVCVVDLPCQTGEGPLWHEDEQCLYWVDIPNGRLYRFDPAANDNQLVYERTGGAIGGFTIQADGALLLFMDRGTIGIWRQGQDLEILVDEIEPERDSRFNDVIADPEGRVLCGTMPSPDGKGRLYRLDTDASLTELLDDIGCSNGMGFTPTHEQVYYIDSPTKLIARFDYDAAGGDLRNREVFVDSTDEEGVPDGMTVDAQGCVWCARWDGSCLIRYDGDGREMQRIHFPARKVSCATFGGPDLQDLYVTTAGGQDRDANGPLAGSLFRLRPGVQGRVEFRSRVGG